MTATHDHLDRNDFASVVTLVRTSKTQRHGISARRGILRPQRHIRQATDRPFNGEGIIIETEVNRRRAIHAAAAIVFELAGQLRQRHGLNNAHVAQAVIEHVQIFKFAW
ncbi:hypothetical protein AI3058V1_4998 [Citrobacter freundii]|nr:hypothetical protein AI3058V1_4998 [Citrobacter freundii]